MLSEGGTIAESLVKSPLHYPAFLAHRPSAFEVKKVHFI